MAETSGDLSPLIPGNNNTVNYNGIVNGNAPVEAVVIIDFIKHLTDEANKIDSIDDEQSLKDIDKKMASFPQASREAISNEYIELRSLHRSSYELAKENATRPLPKQKSLKHLHLQVYCQKFLFCNPV